MILAVAVILLAIFFSLFRAMTPWAEHYKGDIEKHLTKLVGHPVHIQAMETSWYWFEPVLKLDKVTITQANQPVLKLDKLLVGINLFSSLWHWQIQPGILYIEDLNLNIHEIDHHWIVDGLGIGQESVHFDSDAFLPILGWLLAQQKIMLNHVSALVHLQDGSLLPITDLNLSIMNRSGRYRMKGSARLAQTRPTELRLLGDMQINVSNLSRSKGEIYISVTDLLPAQWQYFLPQKTYRIDGGEGDIEFWIDLAKGGVKLIQSKLSFDHLAWTETLNNQSHFLQTLEANLAWKPIDDGWQLSGDQIKIQMAGKHWPENKLLIKYRTSVDDFNLYLKTIDIESLFSAGITWPTSLKPIALARPFGTLHDTEIHFLNHKINFFLTRFSDLGFKGSNKLPGIDHLAGVLNWQPDQGRLEMDSNAIFVHIQDKPPILFSNLNTAIDWKELSHGLRISLDRFVLTRPDLVMSAEGQLDEALTEPKINLEGLFSAQNAQQWFDYIPHGVLKDKLEHWLKKDIKQVGKATGRIIVNGPLKDFPFDKHDGTFTISSILSEVDLYFNEQWPLSKHIDAFLKVDKRSLEADVIKADLSGVEVENLNLRMDDIGYDHETLLIHSKSDAKAEDLMAFVRASPLKKRLSKLKMLDLMGPMGVELRLEIPLYPGNDPVLARGELTFLDNKAVFHHPAADIELDAIAGHLEFDEHGITDSALNARLMTDPVDIRIKSVRTTKPYTEVQLNGHTTIELLKNKLNLPLFSLLKGQLDIAALFTITDDPNDLDHIELNSSLAGVAVDLPKPLGKSATERSKLKVAVDFNPEKALHIDVDYNQRARANLWFNRSQQGFSLHHGEVRVGHGRASTKNLNGVQVVGTLPELDVKAWQETFQKMPTNASSPSLMDCINFIDLELASLHAWGRTLHDLTIRASKANFSDWTIKLKQPHFMANLFYQKKNNLLSGHFDYLHLPKFNAPPKPESLNKVTLLPEQIPNLNLTINDLQLGALDLGNVIIKANSSKNHWNLEYCKLISSAYQMTLQGDWTRNHNHSKTTIKAGLKISDLAQALKQWNASPAVEAQQGEILFKGGWDAPAYDVSWNKLAGNLSIQLRNGRITKLSSETEEKIGLGKLLSILSLQTIPRRLTLDFSDLAKGGYSFDVFMGNFSVKNGVMSTSDSYIDGPVAYASIKGDLDIIKQLYDLNLQVMPHITASLPVVATIAGGPIAGIATWVASKIINHGMQKISSYTYKVTGPWFDPVVQQVSIEKQKMHD